MKQHKIILDNKEVFVSQRGDLFKVVKPWRNEDGKINWFNLLTGGSYVNMMVTIVIVMIILGLLSEYSSNIGILQKQLADCNLMGNLMP